MNASGRRLPRGLYAVTPAGLSGAALLAAAQAALSGGARVLQYRAKPRPERGAAEALLQLCREHGAVLIINDDAELARAIGAHGVHLGRDDGDIARVRAACGPELLIGVSCYNDVMRAHKLAAAGADYLAFGSMFSSPTKPQAVRCPLALLTEARSLGLPVVAIGGITLSNAPSVIEAGADLVAVISDLFEATDIAGRARAFSTLFENGAESP